MSKREDEGSAFCRHLKKAGRIVASWPSWKIAAMRSNDALLSERDDDDEKLARACELVNAAHGGLIVGRHNQAKEDEAEIEKLRDRIRELEESERKARLEAETLAKAMWRRWYKEDSPNFELCDSTAGIITQIDNMVSGMKREKEEPLRFADKRLLERALGSLSKGDAEDATKCIEVVLERSPDFN